MNTHRIVPRFLLSAAVVAGVCLSTLLGIAGCSPADEGEAAEDKARLGDRDRPGETLAEGGTAAQPESAEPSIPEKVVDGAGPGLKPIQVKELIDEARYDEAETLLNSLLAEYPGDPALTSDLAVVYQRTGRAVEALALLQQGLERDPDNYPYHVNLGRAYAEQGEFELALQHLNRALEIKPALASAYELRGMCLMQMNRWSEARGAFQAALSYDGRLPVSHVNMAFLEANVGKWNAVLDHTRRAIEIDAELGRAYILRGWALAERGEFDEAERTLERAAELEPGDQQIAAIRARVAQMRSAAP